MSYREKSMDIGLASIKGTEPVKMEYMAGEGISRPAKTTIIKEKNGKREKEKKREKVAYRESEGKRRKKNILNSKSSQKKPSYSLC